MDPAKNKAAADLEKWWFEQAQIEVEATVLKSLEYGGGDLDLIGYELARMQGREITREEAFEPGILFYLRGKVGRWMAAVLDGRRVSDDTIFDIGIYTRMVQRVRQAGSWPGV